MNRTDFFRLDQSAQWEAWVALAARLAETQRILAIWASEYNLPDNFYDPKGLVMATRNVLRDTDSASGDA
jgi:hypothetical protein